MKPIIKKEITIKELFEKIKNHNKNSEKQYVVLYEQLDDEGLSTNSWIECEDYDRFLGYCNGNEWNDPDASYLKEIIQKFETIKVLPNKIYEFNYLTSENKKDVMKFAFRIIESVDCFWENNHKLVKILKKDGYVFE